MTEWGKKFLLLLDRNFAGFVGQRTFDFLSFPLPPGLLGFSNSFFALCYSLFVNMFIGSCGPVPHGQTCLTFGLDERSYDVILLKLVLAFLAYLSDGFLHSTGHDFSKGDPMVL